MKKLFFFFFLLAQLIVMAQKDSCITLRYSKKSTLNGNDPDKFSLAEFYIYRNVQYHFRFGKNFMVTGRVADISTDSVYVLKYFNSHSAELSQLSQDTVAYPVSQLEAIQAIGDRSMGIFKTLELKYYDREIKKDTTHCEIISEFVKLYDNDTFYTELVPYFTMQGYDLLYEENGATYYFQGTDGIRPVIKTETDDTAYIERFPIGFTPSKTDKINGLGIGFGGYSDGITVNGLNIELPFFHTIYILLSPYNHLQAWDSAGYYSVIEDKTDCWFNGVNIACTHFSFGVMKGVQVNGLTLVAFETKGLTVTGLRSEVYKFSGLSVSGFVNRAGEGKGVQLGLFNNCRDLRGIQMGFWCKNGKRSLPFINWQFKA
ncbi:MAG: hypothetical protein ACOZCO_08760 [Bacteroidota bacterium]